MGKKKREILEVEGKKELTLGQEKTGVEFDLAISTQLVGPGTKFFLKPGKGGPSNTKDCCNRRPPIK